MFSDRELKNQEKIETLIGDQCTIVGNLTGAGVLKIDGTVNGDILWQDDAIISSIGTLKGNISCKSAFISGSVNGNIICEDILTIDSTGRILGDITAKNLIVKEGGTLDGKCTMIIAKNASEVLDI